MKRRTFLGTGLSAAALALVPLRSVFAQSMSVLKTDGGEAVLSAAQLNDFQRSLKGAVIRPSDESYDAVRQVWNAEFDRRPALIVRCASPEDVVRTIAFSRSHDLLTAVRGGGHSMSGKSVCEGGLVINLTAINTVEVDPIAKTAVVGGGALLGQLDAVAQGHGLATTAGVVSHTGVGGLTLGGGLGRLMRKFGLTIDNLLGVDMVTADGRILSASADENSDLFWGVRGGGGNFGVVTAFKFQLHDFDPNVKTFTYRYPFEQAKDLYRFYFEFCDGADRDLYTNANIARLPNGRMSARISGAFYGSDAALDRILSDIKKFGPPTSESEAVVDYVLLQQRIDEQNRYGQRHYAKSGFLDTRDTDVIDTLVDSFIEGPPRVAFASVLPMDGAVSDVASDETAYPHRDALFNIDSATTWLDPTMSQAMVKAGRDFWAPIEPFVGSGFYTNALMDEGASKVQANFKGNYPRLVELKNKYDPTNFFHRNANIAPTV